MLQWEHDVKVSAGRTYMVNMVKGHQSHPQDRGPLRDGRQQYHPTHRPCLTTVMAEAKQAGLCYHLSTHQSRQTTHHYTGFTWLGIIML